MGKILIIAIGSRGDVQPFVSVGLALLQNNHKVTIAAHPEFEHFVKSFSDKFYFSPISNSGLAVMRETESGRAMVNGGNNTFETILVLQQSSKSLQSVYEVWFRDMVSAATSFQPDILILSSFAWFLRGQYIANELLPSKIPYILMHLVPATPTSEFAPAGIQLPFQFLNLPVWKVFLPLLMKPYDNLISRMRNDYKLPPRRQNQAHNDVIVDKASVVYIYSPSIIPKPKDWNENQHVIGYVPPPTEAKSLESMPNELLSFIELARRDRVKLVYVGFGSMFDIICYSDEKATALIDMIISGFASVQKKVQQPIRLILHVFMRKDRVAVPSDLSIMDSKDIFLLKSPVSHELLFPQVEVTVHHGGLGTTHMSLRSGKASLIIPFWKISDQPYWASQIQQIRCRRGGQGIWKLTEESFVYDLCKVINCLQEFTENAELVAQKILKEEAVESFVKLIESKLHT